MPNRNYWLQKGLQMFAESTGWIAIPVVGALFLGRWLDQKNDSAPWFFISLTLLAFIISSIGIGMTGIKYLKQIDNEQAKSKKDNDTGSQRSNQ